MKMRKLGLVCITLLIGGEWGYRLLPNFDSHIYYSYSSVPGGVAIYLSQGEMEGQAGAFIEDSSFKGGRPQFLRTLWYELGTIGFREMRWTKDRTVIYIVNYSDGSIPIASAYNVAYDFLGHRFLKTFTNKMLLSRGGRGKVIPNAPYPPGPFGFVHDLDALWNCDGSGSSECKH